MRYFQKTVIFLFFLGIFASPKICNASEEEAIRAEITELKSRITALEEKLAKQEEKLGEQKEEENELAKIREAFEGLSISAGATFIL